MLIHVGLVITLRISEPRKIRLPRSRNASIAAQPGPLCRWDKTGHRDIKRPVKTPAAVAHASHQKKGLDGRPMHCRGRL